MHKLRSGWLVFFGSLWLNFSTLADTLQERIQKFYGQARPPALNDIPEDASWAGRCVAAGSSRHAYGLLLNFHTIHDPVVGNLHYAIPIFNKDRDRYYHAPLADIQKLRQEALRSQPSYYVELDPRQSGLEETLAFPSGKAMFHEETPYAAATLNLMARLRMKLEEGKPPVFAFALYCDWDGGCNGFGYDEADASSVSKESVGAYCYADRQIFPQVSVSVPKSAPRPVIETSQQAAVPAPKPVKPPSPPRAPVPVPSLPTSNEAIPAVENGTLD